MKKLVLAAAFTVFMAAPALAFECPSRFNKAEAAIKNATAAMNKMGDEKAKGLVHTLIDDAKMLLDSARHNHKKPAAGGLDHARAMAKADSAAAYAMAAEALAAR